MLKPIQFRAMSGYILALFAATYALAGGTAQAQVQFVAVGEGLTVSVAMPDFAAQGAPEVSRQSGMGALGHIVVDELIPKGESFENWSSLYAIKLEEGVNLGFEQYVSQLLRIYLDACDLEVEMIGAMEQAENHLRLVIPCQSHSQNPSTGEVAVFDIRQQDDDFINIYQHWRGPAFSANDMSSWPEGSNGGVARLILNADAARITPN